MGNVSDNLMIELADTWEAAAATAAPAARRYTLRECADTIRMLATSDFVKQRNAPDGYAAAFYEIADMLGIGARSDSPNNVWRNEMRPALRVALGVGSAENSELDRP